jgi:circadian clock protein KaiC
MNTIRNQPRASRLGWPEVSTGIRGLDEITGGGLPAGRPTFVCGGVGVVRRYSP